ncbi:hypothetical protein Mgra_00006694, partial [Meloidogyne graminicola]
IISFFNSKGLEFFSPFKNFIGQLKNLLVSSNVCQMSSFPRSLKLFSPLNGQRISLLSNRLNIFSIFQVRNNSPWHRRNFTQSYFPFSVKRKLKMDNITRRLESDGGRHMLMRRLLGEKHFIT